MRARARWVPDAEDMWSAGPSHPHAPFPGQQVSVPPERGRRIWGRDRGDQSWTEKKRRSHLLPCSRLYAPVNATSGHMAWTTASSLFQVGLEASCGP